MGSVKRRLRPPFNSFNWLGFSAVICNGSSAYTSHLKEPREFRWATNYNKPRVPRKGYKTTETPLQMIRALMEENNDIRLQTPAPDQPEWRNSSAVWEEGTPSLFNHHSIANERRNTWPNELSSKSTTRQGRFLRDLSDRTGDDLTLAGHGQGATVREERESVLVNCHHFSHIYKRSFRLILCSFPIRISVLSQ